VKVRNRTIGPEHAADAITYELERRTKLPIRWAFAVLKGVADREGRFVWHPLALKLAVLPHDLLDFADVLNALESAGLVFRYTSMGRAFGCIPGFHDDQAVNPRETASILPEPTPADFERWRMRAVGTLFEGVDASGTREGAPPDASGTRDPITREPRVVDASESPPNRTNSNGGPEPPARSLEIDDFLSPDKINDLHDFTETLDASTTREAPVNGNGTGSRARGFFSSSVVSSSSSNPEKETTTPESYYASLRNSGPPQPELPAVVHPSAQRLMTTGFVPAGSAQALPAIRGKRTLEAIRERLAQVTTEIASGARRRLLKDQRLKLGAEIVFGYWMEVFNHPRATLATDDARERTLVRHLKDNGEDISELLYVIDGARKDTPRNKDTGEVYDGIPTLFRDRAQIERFANRMPGYKAEKPHPVAVQYADLFRELTEPEAQERAGQVPLLMSGDNGE
jgi:hypothetical protein